MATERRELSKAEAEERLARVFKLMCVGSLTTLLTVGCANMKSESAGTAAVAKPVPTQAVQKVAAQAPAAVADEADAAAEAAAEQMVASLSKPANVVAAPAPSVKQAPVPVPVVPAVKAEPTPAPVPKPVVKDEPKPMPVAAPVVKVEPALVPVSVAPVVKVEPAPAPAPVVVAPEPQPEPVKEEVAEVAAVSEPVMMPSVELEKASDLTAGDSSLSASASKGLPIRFDLWRIDKGRGPYDASVVLTTPTVQMGDDRAASQVYVTVMEDKILVTSSSDIAANKGQSGIRIGEGGWLPFTDVTSDNVGVVRGSWLDKLENGGKLSIRMGFFPTMSKNPEQFESEVSLADMRTAIPRFKKLLK